MSEQQSLAIDKEKIKQAALSGVPLSVTTYVLPHKMEVYINEVLTYFLSVVGQPQMTDYLVYCLNELMSNAKKANTKRVYFSEKGLDISDPDDYVEGMKTFKEDTLNNINRYLLMQKDAGLYIKVVFLAKNNKLKIEVRNNSRLTVFEYKRIHDKICRAQTYSTIQEAMDKIVDETEGAGLGLILMILMLRKIGMADDSYAVLVENNETVVRIEIPFAKTPGADFEAVSDELSKLITDLPSFPENIVEIQRLINDPDSDMPQIADRISNDVVLVADLLKLVNSAAFRTVNPCKHVIDAVKLVGLEGLRNLLYSLGTINLLGDNTEEKRKVWRHSFRVASFSSMMAKNFFPSDRELLSEIYVCGLLHDIGRVIFTAMHNETIQRLSEITKERNISIQVVEQMAAGADHEVLGALIAKKWNFPESIVAAIEFHHSVNLAPKEYARLVSLVAFADQLAHYTAEELPFEKLDENLCVLFNLQDEAKLKEFAAKLAENFDKQG